MQSSLTVPHGGTATEPDAGRSGDRRGGIIAYCAKMAGHLLGAMTSKLVIAAVLALAAFLWISKPANPPRPVINPKPAAASVDVVMTQLTKLDDFHAASATFSASVKVTHKLSFLPCWFWCSSIELHGVGSDDAIVSFASLSAKDIASADRTISVRLPAPYVGPASLDLAKCYVTSNQGFVNWAGRLFHNNPDAAKPLYLTAESEIHVAAERSPLVAEAEQNTRAFLTSLLRRLGYLQIAVNFA